MRNKAIGVFDSGVGGLTVVKKIIELMPAEEVVYLGDTARQPYGTKSAETVEKYALDNAAFLAGRGIKMLVVACHSASSVALETIASSYPMPVVGVIEPGARAAVEVTRNHRVGVIGTEATINSSAYTRALKRVGPSLEVHSRACPLFVPLAEEGWTENEVARATVEIYLASLKRSGIDTLILGCTHYPLLEQPIKEFLGPSVILVDPALEAARSVQRELEESGLVRESGCGGASFFVTDVADRFVRVGGRFLGDRLHSAVRVER